MLKSDKNYYNFSNNTIFIEINIEFNSKIKEITREKLYRSQALEKITPLVEFWQDKMNLYYNKLSYRKAKSQWGSCSSKNNISLNIYLCMLPIELIEYVVVHELSHIVHKNHSKAFWSLVVKYQPNYKDSRKALKKYGHFLQN